MPFRRAHLALLGLFPLILLAFWPGYFGRLREAPFTLHAHGITATAWIALATFQSWSIDRRRVALHRVAGVAVFVVVPLFAAASGLALRDMATLGIAATDPFHAAFGVRLALLDAVAGATFLALVGWGLAERRRVAVHAGAMLATVLLVLPPVIGRLIPGLPGLPVRGPAAFPIGLHMGNLLAGGIALFLATRERRARGPLVLVAAVLAVESLLFDTVARSDAWAALATVAAGLPALPMALSGLVAAGAVLWIAWHRPVTARPRAAMAG